MRHNHMTRARYGTGDFLKLNKRNCDIRIRLTPWDGDFMRVHFRINGDHHYFYPSCVMGDQFSVFLTAVYCLYNEGPGTHYLHGKRWKRGFDAGVWEYPSNENGNHYYKSIPIFWDEEGRIIHVVVSRRSKTEEVLPAGVPDPITIKFKYWKGNFEYCIDGRDLCYAIARGYTEAIKKYGFQGYLHSSGMQFLGDSFEMDELLFIKAYALDAMESRELSTAWVHKNDWRTAKSSSFEKEIELLLFDM